MLNTEEAESNENSNISQNGQSNEIDQAAELRKVLSEMKKEHLTEITELRNQLDEVRTRATIIETTKQDELDELKYRHKQELDSLNHIINALQSDLNTVRHDYELISNNYKEFKKQIQMSNLNEIKSPVSSTSSNLANRLNLSPFGSSANSSASKLTHGQHNINQENENLEEDMRKAKESAEMLRSVVLPLETEITTLRSRSNTSEKRVLELEKIIDEKEKERQKMLEEEQKLIDESFNVPIETEIENFTSQSNADNIYFKKFIQLKKYLKRNENKFINLQQMHLKAIKQIYSILTHEQKIRLIPNRSKSKSISSSSTKSDENNKQVLETITDENNLNSDNSFVVEQNETISKIEELIDFLVTNKPNDDNQSFNNKSLDTASLSSDLSIMTNNDLLSKNLNNSNLTLEQMPVYSYAELLALYEHERNYRINYMEINFQQKANESNKKIEDLNREMTNLASVIEEMRKQYMALQQQYKFQLDQLIKVNDELRSDIKKVEFKNEQYKQENLKLKAENKQFYGDQTILVKEIDEQYQTCSSIDEAQRQNVTLKQELVKLILAHQALNKQLSLSSETIKHLQKVNLQYQQSNNVQDHLVIAQSLESELERERKVRVEAETDLQEYKNQLLVIKERGQALVESLKQRNEQNEFEIRKLKEDNQELQNQIQSLKKDAKNSLSVQEDLVRLIQSLQIELNQTKPSGNDGMVGNGPLEVRCQHEDDFSECAACKNVFSVTRRKHRCKHCCKIFCADCCSKTVYSGPNLRPHKVCASCHTLLDKDSNSNSNPSSSTSQTK